MSDSELKFPREKMKDPTCPICGQPVEGFYGSFDAGYRCWKHGKVEPISKPKELK